MKTIQSQYNFTSKVYKALFKTIDENIKLSNYSWTLKALVKNNLKLEFIHSGIVDCKNNYYASQILTRTLFEHYLVGYYLWIKIAFEKDDSSGKAYYQYYMPSEFFKQDNYSFGINNIKENKKETLSIERLRKISPELKDIEQADLQEFHQKANQFDIKKIGDYLNNKIIVPEKFKILHLSMLGFLERYNLLSSFVHGGPTAEMHTFENAENVNQSEICLENINWAKSVSKNSKENIISALAFEFPKIYTPVFIEITNHNNS